MRIGPCDDGREHRERTALDRDEPERDLGRVVEDVVARPDLRHAVRGLELVRSRRRADAARRCLDSEYGELLGRLADRRALGGRDRAQLVGALRAVRMPRERQHARERRVAVPLHEGRDELRRGRAGLRSDPPRAGFDLPEPADLDARVAARVVETRERSLGVERDAQAHRARELGEPVEACATHRRIHAQQIRVARGREHLGLS